MDSMSVVVSGEGSPVSPETNIICGRVRVRPMSNIRLSDDGEGKERGNSEADIDVDNAMATTCRLRGVGNGVKEIGA
jgi:hypothetical protein